MSNHNFPVSIRMRRGHDVSCSWCGMFISKGEVYASWGQVHDGRLNRLTMHSDCYHGGWKMMDYLEDFSPGEMVAGQPEFDE